MRWEKASDEKLVSQIANGEDHTQRDNLKLVAPEWAGKWVVGMDDYSPQLVGAKSRNIAGLRQKIPEWIQLPSSVTIPFGTFEKVLDMEPNKDIKRAILESLQRVPDGASNALRTCRDAAMQVSHKQTAFLIAQIVLNSSMWKMARTCKYIWTIRAPQ